MIKLIKDEGIFVIKLIKDEPVYNFEEYYARLINLTSDLDGAFVEFGYGVGVSANIFLSSYASRRIEKDVYLFDSFKGFPAPTKEDLVTNSQIAKGDWNKSSLERAVEETKQFGAYGIKVKVVPGFFKDSLPLEEITEVSLLHLDCDLYESYKTTLEQMYDTVEVGGVIAFDEYKSPVQLKRFPGAAKAIDEFFSALISDVVIHEVPFYNGKTIKYYMIKGE